MTAPQPSTPTAAPNPVELLRSKSYLVLLVLGAIIGIPVAVVAYFFLKLVAVVQHYIFTTLPNDLFDKSPIWWPIPWLMLSGLLVAACIKYLPGTSGHEPSKGFQAGGPLPPIELPGVFLAALTTLSLGAVLGPEAPLIAIGSGMGVLAVHLLKKDAPTEAVMVIGAAGSFAAISTLLGSPIIGAFLLMEVTGIGGPMLGIILLPGLLAAGIGSLIFVGLDAWTGFGTFSLSIPNIPVFTTPAGVQFLWAIVIGLMAAVLGTAISRAARYLLTVVEKNRLAVSPLMGLGVGLCAMAFAQLTDHGTSELLFSGQDELPTLITQASSWSVGALVALVLLKGLAYAFSLSAFRGGPIFPAMFVGAALGMAMSHSAGLPMIAGVGMGIGAMTVVMLRLPLTSVLLATVFLSADGVALVPLIIVAVVVAYVASAHFIPVEPADDAATATPA
ncbi:chloride channel protein [soil metagenome]